MYDTILLRDLGIEFGDNAEFKSAEDVVNYLLLNERGSEFMKDMDFTGGIADLIDELSDDNGEFDEDKATQILMDSFDGMYLSGYDPQEEAYLEWEDHRADEMAGR